MTSKVSSSRIVMRTMGSLKVILNTKVYKGMSVEQVWTSTHFFNGFLVLTKIEENKLNKRGQNTFERMTGIVEGNIFWGAI